MMLTVITTAPYAQGSYIPHIALVVIAERHHQHRMERPTTKKRVATSPKKVSRSVSTGCACKHRNTPTCIRRYAHARNDCSCAGCAAQPILHRLRCSTNGQTMEIAGTHVSRGRNTRDLMFGSGEVALWCLETHGTKCSEVRSWGCGTDAVNTQP